MRTKWTSIIGMAALSVCLLWAGGCGSSSNDQNSPTASISSPNGTGGVDSSSDGVTATPELKQNAETAAKLRAQLYPEVEIATNLGRIRIKLNAEKAPQTVENFLLNYVDRGFYSGTVFHYVENDFIVIAGGYTADLSPKPTRAPIRNEARTAPKNVRGTVAMSRHADYADSATSQFFINLVDNPDLDYQEAEEAEEGQEGGSDGYCVFGEVIEGMDVVGRIANRPVKDVGEFPNVPVDPVVIESITRLDQDGGAVAQR